MSSTYTQPFGSIHTCELPRTGRACVCSPLGAASVWKCSHCDSFPRKMVKRPQSWRWVHLRGRCRLQHRFVEVLHLVSANNGKYVRGILHYVRDRNTDSQESRNGCQRAVFYIDVKPVPYGIRTCLLRCLGSATFLGKKRSICTYRKTAFSTS